MSKSLPLSTGKQQLPVPAYFKQLTFFSDEIVSKWLTIIHKTYRTYKKTEVAIREDVQEITKDIYANVIVASRAAYRWKLDQQWVVYLASYRS